MAEKEATVFTATITAADTTGGGGGQQQQPGQAGAGAGGGEGGEGGERAGGVGAGLGPDGRELVGPPGERRRELEEAEAEAVVVTKYLVKWEGLPYAECTWETAEDIIRAGGRRRARVCFGDGRDCVGMGVNWVWQVGEGRGDVAITPLSVCPSTHILGSPGTLPPAHYTTSSRAHRLSGPTTLAPPPHAPTPPAPPLRRLGPDRQLPPARAAAAGAGPRRGGGAQAVPHQGHARAGAAAQLPQW